MLCLCLSFSIRAVRRMPRKNTQKPCRAAFFRVRRQNGAAPTIMRAAHTILHVTVKQSDGFVCLGRLLYRLRYVLPKTQSVKHKCDSPTSKTSKATGANDVETTVVLHFCLRPGALCSDISSVTLNVGQLRVLPFFLVPCCDLDVFGNKGTVCASVSFTSKNPSRLIANLRERKIHSHRRSGKLGPTSVKVVVIGIIILAPSYAWCGTCFSTTQILDYSQGNSKTSC